MPEGRLRSGLGTLVLIGERDGRRAAALVLVGEHRGAHTPRYGRLRSILSTTVLTDGESRVVGTAMASEALGIQGLAEA